MSKVQEVYKKYGVSVVLHDEVVVDLPKEQLEVFRGELMSALVEDSREAFAGWCDTYPLAKEYLEWTRSQAKAQSHRRNRGEGKASVRGRHFEGGRAVTTYTFDLRLVIKAETEVEADSFHEAYRVAIGRARRLLDAAEERAPTYELAVLDSVADYSNATWEPKT